MPDLSKIYLFRMTHIENILHILQHGITHVSSLNANATYVSIGDVSLIRNRNAFVMPNKKTLGEYIPFYFGVRMPMLYVIQNGYNGVQETTTENIVYCVSSVQQILNHHLPFIFTNGHAVDALTDFFVENDIARIETIIDWPAIKARYWKNDNDLDLKRRKEAEFLVESDIPTTAIVGWIVYNEKVKSRMIAMGIADAKILVKPNSYF